VYGGDVRSTADPVWFLSPRGRLLLGTARLCPCVGWLSEPELAEPELALVEPVLPDDRPPPPDSPRGTALPLDSAPAGRER